MIDYVIDFFISAIEVKDVFRLNEKLFWLIVRSLLAQYHTGIYGS